MVEYVHSVFKIVLSGHPPNFKLSAEHQDAKWVTPEEALKMSLVPGGHEYIKLVLDSNI